MNVKTHKHICKEEVLSHYKWDKWQGWCTFCCWLPERYLLICLCTLLLETNKGRKLFMIGGNVIFFSKWVTLCQKHQIECSNLQEQVGETINLDIYWDFRHKYERKGKVMLFSQTELIHEWNIYNNDYLIALIRRVCWPVTWS